MKVLVITHAGGNPNVGPNLRWFNMGLALKDLDVEVEIAASSYFHKYIKPPAGSRRFRSEVVEGIRFHWMKTRPYTQRGLWQVLNQIEFSVLASVYHKTLAARRPDVVVASSPHPMVALPAILVSRRLSIPMIYETRDVWPQALVEMGMNRRHPYCLLLSACERLAVKNAKLVVSVKPGDFLHFRDRHSLPESSFRYVPNGFYPQETSVESVPPDEFDELRSRYEYLVVYVGAVSRYYDLTSIVRLADSMKRRSDVGFVVVGDGDQLAALKERSQQIAADNLHFLGAVPKATTRSIIRSADICYTSLVDIPLHANGVSCNKIFEYMEAGKPILASHSVGFDPIVESGGGMCSSPSDPQLLVEHLGSMLDDPAELRAMGERGAEHFRRFHNFRVVAADMKRSLVDAQRAHESGLNSGD